MDDGAVEVGGDGEDPQGVGVPEDLEEEARDDARNVFEGRRIPSDE